MVTVCLRYSFFIYTKTIGDAEPLTNDDVVFISVTGLRVCHVSVRVEEEQSEKEKSIVIVSTQRRYTFSLFVSTEIVQVVEGRKERHCSISLVLDLVLPFIRLDDTRN